MGHNLALQRQTAQAWTGQDIALQTGDLKPVLDKIIEEVNDAPQRWERTNPPVSELSVELYEELREIPYKRDRLLHLFTVLIAHLRQGDDETIRLEEWLKQEIKQTFAKSHNSLKGYAFKLTKDCSETQGYENSMIVWIYQYHLQWAVLQQCLGHEHKNLSALLCVHLKNHWRNLRRELMRGHSSEGTIHPLDEGKLADQEDESEPSDLSEPTLDLSSVDYDNEGEETEQNDPTEDDLGKKFERLAEQLEQKIAKAPSTAQKRIWIRRKTLLQTIKHWDPENGDPTHAKLAKTIEASVGTIHKDFVSLAELYKNSMITQTKGYHQ